MAINFKEMVEEFMSGMIKVTILAKTESAESTAVEIGKPEAFDALREKAHNRVLGYIGCECTETPKALPKAFNESEEEPVEPEVEIPGQIKMSEMLDLDAESESESEEETAKAAPPEKAEEEEEDPFSFLDDAFNEADAAEAEPEPEAEADPEADEPAEEPEAETEPESEPEPPKKKRGRPRKVDTPSADGMTKEKAEATVVQMVSGQDKSAFKDLVGMTMGEVLAIKPKMAEIMTREHLKGMFSEETLKAAEFLAKK